VSAKVSFEPSHPWRDEGFSRTLPPTFLFLQYSVFKEQTSQTRCRGPLRFWLRGLSSVAHAALLNFAEGRFRSELLRRQRRAALVGEAYIVGGRPKCQQRFRSFLNFLRRKISMPILGSRLPRRHGDAKPATLAEPYCRRITVRHQANQAGACAPGARLLIRDHKRATKIRSVIGDFGRGQALR
jgi:hypothetical protein